MLTNIFIDDIMSVTTLWSSIGNPVVVVLTNSKFSSAVAVYICIVRYILKAPTSH